MSSAYTSDEVRMLRAKDRVDHARNRVHDLESKYRETVRRFLKFKGWVEEVRYDGDSHGYWLAYVRVYRRPTGKLWHTMNGALTAQRKRDRSKR